MAGHGVLATRVIERVPLVAQELPTFPEHLSSHPDYRVVHSLVFYILFVDHCLLFFFWPLCCLFFFNLRLLITSLWYRQTFICMYPTSQEIYIIYIIEYMEVMEINICLKF